MQEKYFSLHKKTKKLKLFYVHRQNRYKITY